MSQDVDEEACRSMSLTDAGPHAPSDPRPRLWYLAALGVAAAVFLAAYPVFSTLCVPQRYFDPNSDFDLHLGIVRKMLKGEMPPHPLFHLAVASLWDARQDPGALILAASTVLAVALAARAGITFLMVHPPHGGAVKPALACLALILAMPLFNWWKFPNVYMGQLTPNVWHNPTTIFAMPLALLLFALAVRGLGSPSVAGLAVVGLTMVVTDLAKPNYLLAFLPCFGPALLLVLVRSARRGALGVGQVLASLVVSFGPIAAALCWQFFRTYGDTGENGAGIGIAPFKLWWLHHTSVWHMVAGFLLGLVFPIGIVACYPKEARSDWSIVLSWCVLAIAAVQSALLVERGTRFEHGNFGWGAVFADQVLFVASAALLLRRCIDRRFVLCASLLGAHALVGLVYLLRALEAPTRIVDF